MIFCKKDNKKHPKKLLMGTFSGVFNYLIVKGLLRCVRDSNP